MSETTYYKGSYSSVVGLPIMAKNKTFHNDYLAVAITPTIPKKEAEALADAILNFLGLL